MLFAADIAVEQDLTVGAITIAIFIFTRFSCTTTHVRSKPSSNFALDTDSLSRSAKLAHM